MDSAHYAFGRERHACVKFQGRRILLVFGRLGIRSPGGIRGPEWRLVKRLFALAPSEDAQRLNRSGSVFRLIASANGYSVFLVSVDGWLRAEKASQRETAPRDRGQA